MTPTLAIIHRYGKEHGEGGFQTNSKDFVERHLVEKAKKFREEFESDSRWFQVSDSLILERPSDALPP